MMKVMILIMMLGFAGGLYAQMSDYSSSATGKHGTMTVRKTYSEVYKVVEQMPVFLGGNIALMQYLSSIPYPKEARENDIQGMVYLSFVIDTSGNITLPKIVKSSGSQVLDDASLEHLRKMPKWQPGRQRGEAVRVEMTAPINFKLS